MSKILLTLPDDLLASLDEYCKKFSYERSEMIRRLIRGIVYPRDILQDEFEKKLENKNSTIDIPEEVETIKPVGGSVISGWCQLHFEKGKTYPIKEITWEDENGTPLVDKKWACPKCVEKYQNMGKGKLSFV